MVGRQRARTRVRRPQVGHVARLAGQRRRRPSEGRQAPAPVFRRRRQGHGRPRHGVGLERPDGDPLRQRRRRYDPGQPHGRSQREPPLHPRERHLEDGRAAPGARQGDRQGRRAHRRRPPHHPDGRRHAIVVFRAERRPQEDLHRLHSRNRRRPRLQPWRGQAHGPAGMEGQPQERARRAHRGSHP